MSLRRTILVIALVFFGAACLVLLLGRLTGGMPAFDPSGTAATRDMVDRLPEYDIAALKFGARALAPSYGVFGNSRSVQLGANDLGLKEAEFFNYSVPGGSLRQSVALVGELARAGSVPATVIVSVDHFEMAFMSRSAFPAGPRRWWRAVQDVVWVADRFGLMLALRTAADHVFGEWRQFSTSWNVAQVWSRLSFIRAAFAGGAGRTSRWREDGSRVLVAEAVRNMSFVRKEPFVLHEAFLVKDLHELSELSREFNLRVVLYETPVDPGNDARLRADPTAAATRLRGRFLRECSDLALRCHPAPRLDGADDSGWSDCCHAPPELLGAYVRSLL